MTNEMNNNLSIKGPKGSKIDLSTTIRTLHAFSDDTIYAAIQDIIYSVDLSQKDEYSSFIKELSTLIKGQGARTRLENSLIAQIKLLERRKPAAKTESKDISQVFTEGQDSLDSLSSDLKLQLDITNYILEYFKKGDFAVVEQCLDVLLQKDVLMNTVKNFIKKEINYFISKQDSDNIKRLTQKYARHPKLAPVIKEQLDQFLGK
ncbi:MAG: hypothetical protein OEZ36_12730 [Spirochaetota bacterium]|nr:hypothetical protein [Spirochaetota bacterium]